MQVSDYTKEELNGMSLKLLSTLQVESIEEEQVLQEVVTAKRRLLPVSDVYRKDFMNNLEDSPEWEAKAQEEIDARAYKKRLASEESAVEPEPSLEPQSGTSEIVTEPIPEPEQTIEQEEDKLTEREVVISTLKKKGIQFDARMKTENLEKLL